MRLEQITYFLTVAEHQNITAAARALFISQPALSKQIALLEQEIGVPLFERKTRGVTLTDAGRQFEHDLKNILRELETAKKNAVLAGRAGKTLLNVGCFDGVYTDDFLPDFYEYMKGAAPEQKLILHTFSFAEGAASMKKGRVDILLTLSKEWKVEKGFCVKPLVHRNGALVYSERFYSAKVVTPDGGEVQAHRPRDIAGSGKSQVYSRKDGTESGKSQEHSPKDVAENGKMAAPDWSGFANETCIMVKKSTSPGMFRYARQNMDALKLDPDRIEEVDNISTLLSYVKLGRGYTILSEDVVLGEKELKKVILPSEMGVDVVAVWSEKNELAARLMRAYDSKNR